MYFQIFVQNNINMGNQIRTSLKLIRKAIKKVVYILKSYFSQQEQEQEQESNVPLDFIPREENNGYAGISSNVKTAYDLGLRFLKYNFSNKYNWNNWDKERLEKEINRLNNKIEDTPLNQSKKELYILKLLKEKRAYIHPSPEIPLPDEKFPFPQDKTKNDMILVEIPGHTFCLYYDAQTKQKYILDNGGIGSKEYSAVKKAYENESYEVITWGKQLTTNQKVEILQKNAAAYHAKNPNLSEEDAYQIQRYCVPTVIALMQAFYENKSIDTNAFKQGTFNVLEKIENYVNGIGASKPRLQRRNSMFVPKAPTKKIDPKREPDAIRLDIIIKNYKAYLNKTIKTRL